MGVRSKDIAGPRGGRGAIPTGEPLRQDVIVIGASAGGLDALTTIASALPSDLPAAVFVVMHFPTTHVSTLPDILSRSGPLPARHAVHGDVIRPGQIYVAPPDNHLLLEAGAIRAVRGPKENGHRPAIDPLFRSAARAYGPRVIGVVLSGGRDDGTLGLLTIRSLGGTSIVQDPDDALVPEMPRSAVTHVKPDLVLPLSEIGGALARLAGSPVDPAHLERFWRGDAEKGAITTRSELTCPECNGSLTETTLESVLQFQCHVGHVFSLDTMIAEQAEQLEAALWAAVRALEESEALAQRMVTRADRTLTDRFEDKAAALRQHAQLIRRILVGGETLTVSDSAVPNGPTTARAEALRASSED